MDRRAYRVEQGRYVVVDVDERRNQCTTPSGLDRTDLYERGTGDGAIERCLSWARAYGRRYTADDVVDMGAEVQS